MGFLLCRAERSGAVWGRAWEGGEEEETTFRERIPPLRVEEKVQDTALRPSAGL